MENLERLKCLIFSKKDASGAIEECYADLLKEYSPACCNIFINLLEMSDKNARIDEILKVLDFVRFPVKKAI